FSAVDGPGNRGVVFLQGCDFDCSYCHNPETRMPCSACGACIGVCPETALSGGPVSRPVWDRELCRDCGSCVAACRLGSSPKVRRLGAGAVLDELEPYRPFLRGVTVSGGECLLQPEFLSELLELARSRGLPGLVDTNGSRPLASLPRILGAAEGFMLDVKAWNEAEHWALTGSTNAGVLENLRFLAGRDALYEVRTVLAPGSFDLEETVRETAAVLAATRSRARYRLIRYRPFGVRADRAAILHEPDEALMERLSALALAAGAATVLVS
ncbi:MAG TPA: YjjW family glycine radical enzyme activase, partial [Rectinemataceae bacterium]|nr:YjjW family glycine radical enzyme activase [Rectinemataceae bacterium]